VVVVVAVVVLSMKESVIRAAGLVVGKPRGFFSKAHFGDRHEFKVGNSANNFQTVDFR
jgi:hypothetical protein